jgi:NAD(P)-dependent dehydrogenase (short-subunit alcohol dehydrogenase family)
MRFADKVAVVTGAAHGICSATAREFAAEGAKVAILDIDGEAGRQFAEEFGVAALAVELDVADAEACVEAADAVARKWGRIDHLVNGAVSFIAKGSDATTRDWELSLGVNVRGYANAVQACAPHMAPGSSIVNISSISAHVVQPERWTYNASKGAINMLSKCQALDLSARGIRVNIVSPGWIWTREVDKAADGDRDKWGPIWGGFHMLRRLGEPREVARAILFLCSEDASFITATELMVDGGYLAMGPEGLGDRSAFAGSE